jgi:hypothetical protein
VCRANRTFIERKATWEGGCTRPVRSRQHVPNAAGSGTLLVYELHPVAGPPVALPGAVGRRRPVPLLSSVPLPCAFPPPGFLCVAKQGGRCRTRTHDLNRVNPF